MKPTTFTITITSDDVDGWFDTTAEARGFIDWCAKHADRYKELVTREMYDNLGDYGQDLLDDARAAAEEFADRQREDAWEREALSRMGEL